MPSSAWSSQSLPAALIVSNLTTSFKQEPRTRAPGVPYFVSRVFVGSMNEIYRPARAGSCASFPDLNVAKRLLISSQLTTFHHADKYSGRRLLYFR
jgi:hypothetical protein